ncbi:pseudouridine synthase [Paraferrimonas sp. SM1919]|uniref:pseudouridine synthase n=1 Tax=Paraferrimonas sp. SM1919 TaxID=2662263 RepID=UPI0013D4A494|nr:16S rRNA pseudouridine(516) synthase [Paraferrimonas sp. SM1919]
MQTNQFRLDRFIAKQCQIKKAAVRLMVAQKRITVNDLPPQGVDQIICQFDKVCLDGKCFAYTKAKYFLLHKPVGVVSATKDDAHKTVLDLLSTDDASDLHIVGRLDLNTSGLVLLTNDGRFSKALMHPDAKVDKVYLVTLANELTDEYASAFAKGMEFSYEGITTMPAQLEIVSQKRALVTLQEGKYHQIKRMFGRFRNPVLALHRQSVGSFTLTDVAVGQYRALTQAEVEQVLSKTQ